MKILPKLFFLAAIAVSAAPLSFAQENYVSLSAGASLLQDSDNSGALTRNFTTGAGTTIPAGTVLPSGTSLGWTTEFDTGYSASAAIGRRFGDSWRGEIEIGYQSNDVDRHSGVRVGGGLIDAQDAGVLITGSPNLGVTVGALVDDGRGSVATTFLMGNVYYDLPAWGSITPYVGAGLGVGMVEVDYSPSGVSIIDDDATVVAYQAVFGATLGLNEQMSLFAQYRYRATGDVETDSALLPAQLDIENGSSTLEGGLRIRF